MPIRKISGVNPPAGIGKRIVKKHNIAPQSYLSPAPNANLNQKQNIQKVGFLKDWWDKITGKSKNKNNPANNRDRHYFTRRERDFINDLMDNSADREFWKKEIDLNNAKWVKEQKAKKKKKRGGDDDDFDSLGYINHL